MSDQNPSPKDEKEKLKAEKSKPEEISGFGEKGNKLPEPTRFGDWEVKGRCSDF